MIEGLIKQLNALLDQVNKSQCPIQSESLQQLFQNTAILNETYLKKKGLHPQKAQQGRSASSSVYYSISGAITTFMTNKNRYQSIMNILNDAILILKLRLQGVGQSSYKEFFTEVIQLSILQGAYIIEFIPIKESYQGLFCNKAGYRDTALGSTIIEFLGGETFINENEKVCRINHESLKALVDKANQSIFSPTQSMAC